MPESNPTESVPPATKLQTAQLEEQVARIIGNELMELPPGFDSDANLYNAGLDSMALMRLLILIENHFNLVLSESDLARNNFTTIRTLAVLIRNRLEQAV